MNQTSTTPTPPPSTAIRAVVGLLASRPAAQYALAVAAVALATLARWLVDPALGDQLSFLTYFLAVLVAAWLTKLGPSILALVLGALAGLFFFVPPRYTLAIHLDDPERLAHVARYMILSAAIIGVCEAMRRARQRALEQAERLRTTLASIGDGVITTDAEGRITTMNAVAEALTGWTSDEAGGLPMTQVFHIVNESTRLEVDNPALRALKEGVIVGLANHTLLIAKDGTERPIDDSAAPIRSVSGEVLGCVLVFRDISDRYRLEAEHREARQQIVTTLESVTDGFVRYDQDWRIVYVNAQAERIYGLNRSEMLGKIVWEVFPAMVGTQLEVEYRRAITEQVTVEFESYYEPFGRWYSLKGYPTADGGLTTFIRDITEQKLVERQLVESDARYRAIGESIDYGVWVCDPTGRNVYASASFLRMVGITQQQCSDFGWGDVLHPEDAEATIEAWKECVRTHGTWDRVHRFKGADGKWHHVLARGLMLRDTTGRNMGWAGINLDITRMVETEQEMVRIAAESERQRRLYETVLTNTPDFVYVFSLDHKVVYANDALIKMWGRGREGAIGKTFVEIGYEPWHAEMHIREIDHVRATRQAIRGEVPFNGTNGRRIYDYIFVPVIGSDGEVEAVAGTTRDVTERKETEDHLRRNHDTFFALIQNNPFGVYAVDADFRLRQVSLGAQKVFETVRPLLGRDFAEVLRTLWSEPFASEMIARFRHTLDTGEPYSAQSTVERRVDIGAAETYDWRIERISLPDGRYGVVCYFYDLTERQRLEATLLDSEERLRLATDAAELGIWTWQPEVDLVVWENDRPREIFALPSNEPPITAARFKTEFLHPEDVETFELAYRRAIQIKVPLLCECRIRRTDGETRWVEFTGRVVDGEENLRLIGTVRDVTDRKQAEEALRVSEARHSFAVTLADALRPLSDPIAVQAEASRVLGERLRANRVVYFEIRDDEYVIERDYTSGVGPLAGRYPVSAFGPALLASLLEGRTVVEADATTEPDRTSDERAAYADIQVRGHVDVPLVKGGRFVAGMTVHVSDRREWTRHEVALIEDTAERTWAAVERVRVEAALRRSEERRRLALDAAELGAWQIDLVTNTLTTDERFRIIFAGTTKAMDYEEAFAAIHPNDQQRIREAVAASTRSDDPAPYAEEYRVVHPDGSVRWVFAQGRANYDRERPSQLVSFDGTIADITERKLIEQERERLVGQLRDADRRKDEFLATLAHELRNPLSPVRAAVQFLHIHGQPTPELQWARDVIDRQTQAMARLIDDLMDMSRINQGKIQLKREHVELAKIVQGAVETSRPMIEEMRHHLTMTLPPFPVIVNADLTRLAQVFLNVLNNAAKYTERGGRIELRAQVQGSDVVVSVTDTGIGIPADKLPTIFEMFSQVEGALSRSQGGLGIGLSLVKRLVEMHDGSVEARSGGPGKGSEFLVRLPIVVEQTYARMASDDGDRATPTANLRILVVDDNRDSVQSLAMLLKVMGNSVHTAYDGEEAVSAAREFRPHVVLCDIGLPKLNGYEAARKMKQQAWDAKMILIALTGWGQDQDRRQAQEAGFDHHMVKPVDAHVLMKILAGLDTVKARRNGTSPAAGDSATVESEN